MNVLLWGVLPYVMMAILVGGLIWRYRYDQFGWTTRSSQLYESRLLRIGSPLFHFGILVVIIGHIGGLIIPKSWTEAVGITEGMYHFNALLWGTLAGICTLVGILILIYRRRTTGPVFMATTKNDKAMYVVLVAAIVAGFTCLETQSCTGSTQAHCGRQAAAHLADVVPLRRRVRWFRGLLHVPADIFKNVYGFGLTGAGTRTAGFAIAAVLARPVGGILADRIGPRIVVAISLGGAAVMSLIVALRLPPEIPAGASFALMALFLGLGTGGVFAWVAELAPAERVGAITGVVGACGGLGGFFPPLVMGATYNEAAHSYTIGLVLLTITASGALLFTLFGIRRKAPAAA